MTDNEENKIDRDPRTYAIIGAAMAVHRELGNGFLEAVYQEALAMEFGSKDVPYQQQIEIPVYYQGTQLNTSYRADFICYDQVIAELKAIKEISDIERAQVLNYLKATGHKVGLLLNFGARSLECGRFVL